MATFVFALMMASETRAGLLKLTPAEHPIKGPVPSSAMAGEAFPQRMELGICSFRIRACLET
ncbi:MAG: hypothetical protein JWM59_3553 [Verrucomicrobiales bacterium]|nr:hypothetical protein [Verrucomicrobiales bacterium]